MEECIVCLENRDYMTMGACGHGNVCLECTYKNRVISKNKRCAYCNKSIESVVVFCQQESAPDLSNPRLREFKEGLLYASEECRIQCLKLENKTCFIDKCRASFSTLPQLVDHMKRSHNRCVCSLCVENRALLLKEQRVYRTEELDRHLLFGDYDDENNLIFLHPHCHFCNTYLFNDDRLSEHLRKDHYNCGLCDPKEHKHVFYKDFPSLSVHYELSHYLCEHPECARASAFKTKFELDKHDAAFHKKVKTKANPLAVNLEDTQEKNIQDNQGFDFTNAVFSSVFGQQKVESSRVGEVRLQGRVPQAHQRVALDGALLRREDSVVGR